jgi:hypothetical protein
MAGVALKHRRITVAALTGATDAPHGLLPARDGRHAFGVGARRTRCDMDGLVELPVVGGTSH